MNSRMPRPPCSGARTRADRFRRRLAVNIVHLLQTLDASGGGLPAAVKALAVEQSKSGYRVYLMSSDGADTMVDSLGCIAPRAESPEGHHGRARLLSRLREFSEMRTVDVLHLHGVWNAEFVAIVRWAERLGIVTVMSPHGQLMPALLASDSLLKKMKKRAFLGLFGERMLSKVSMIHAVGHAELRALEHLALGPPVMQIPNFVDRHLLDLSLTQEPATWDVEERVLLFLGRVERRKGVANLVDAFIGSDVLRGWRFEIVGPIEDEDLALWIRSAASRLAHPHRLSLAGPAFGEQKLEKLRCAHVVCLPSYSEVIGLVNIEAALMGRLVITTPQAGVDEIAGHGGVVCSNDPIVLRTTLESLSSISVEEYTRRCVELQRWARKEFAYERIIETWNSTISMLTGIENANVGDAWP